MHQLRIRFWKGLNAFKDGISLLLKLLKRFVQFLNLILLQRLTFSSLFKLLICLSTLALSPVQSRKFTVRFRTRFVYEGWQHFVALRVGLATSWKRRPFEPHLVVE